MDASTIAAAYTSTKVALETLRTIIFTKADIAADSRVIDALEQLGKVHDTLFELRARVHHGTVDLAAPQRGLRHLPRTSVTQSADSVPPRAQATHRACRAPTTDS